MRKLMFILLAVVVGTLAAGCGHSGQRDHAEHTATSTTTTTTAPPVAEDALKGLLLRPEEVNPVMEVTDLKVTGSHDALSDDSATMEPRECLAVDGAAQTEIYAGSGYTAVREQTLSDGEANAHFVDQAVVLFPTAKQAAAFFDASAKQWPACHEYTHTQSGTQWTAGPISNVGGVLSTVATQQNAGESAWQACGRALTARNNVVVDVNTCSTDPKDSAVAIANQIAARVPTDRA